MELEEKIRESRTGVDGTIPSTYETQKVIEERSYVSQDANNLKIPLSLKTTGE